MREWLPLASLVMMAAGVVSCRPAQRAQARAWCVQTYSRPEQPAGRASSQPAGRAARACPAPTATLAAPEVSPWLLLVPLSHLARHGHHLLQPPPLHPHTCQAVVEVLARLQVPEQRLHDGAPAVGQHGRGQGLARDLVVQAQPVPGACVG
jgi:hypothetical protein